MKMSEVHLPAFQRGGDLRSPFAFESGGVTMNMAAEELSGDRIDGFEAWIGRDQDDIVVARDGRRKGLENDIDAAAESQGNFNGQRNSFSSHSCLTGLKN